MTGMLVCCSKSFSGQKRKAAEKEERDRGAGQAFDILSFTL